MLRDRDTDKARYIVKERLSQRDILWWIDCDTEKYKERERQKDREKEQQRDREIKMLRDKETDKARYRVKEIMYKDRLS